jgi:hypothetical protein
MKKLKKTILGSLLTYVLLSASTKASNPIQIPTTLKDFRQVYSQEPATRTQFQPHLQSPKTIEDYLNLYNIKLTEETERRNTLFEYLESQKIISKYVYDSRRPQTFSDTHFPTKEEIRTVKRACIRTIKKALRETRRDSPEIEEFEDNIIDFLGGFYLSIKGPMANGYTGIPSLDEKTRQESIKRRDRIKILEETVSELGRRYRVEFDGKFKYNFKGKPLTDIFQGIETEASLRDFQILGQRFHKLKIKAT